MRPSLLSGFAVTDWLAGAMRPTTPDALSDGPPMGVMESWMVVGALGLACWGLARLVIWLDIKIKTHALVREIHRELGIGYPGRFGSHRRRLP